MKASLLPALEQEPTEQIQFWPSAEIRVSLLHYQSQEEQAWAQHGSNVQWEAHSSASFTLNNSVTSKCYQQEDLASPSTSVCKSRATVWLGMVTLDM